MKGGENMYTLIIYDEETLQALDVIPQLNDPRVIENNITWENGRLESINKPFIVVEGDVNIKIDDDVSSYIGIDVKKRLKPEEVKQKEAITNMQSMLNNVLLDSTNKNQDQQIKAMQQMINTMMFNQAMGGSKSE